MLPIAAQMPMAMFTPIVVLVIAHAALSIVAGRARSHDDRARAERYSNYAFAIVLVSAAYAVVLLVATVFTYPSRFYDMLLIILVIAAFFVLLLFAFFLLAEVIPRAFRRGGGR
jgi:cell division protein FtsW (lipid II flippase)